MDPRNSAWSKDESKFGQKMLERMGWSKGKGLGKTEQGATEHIKVKVKNNSLGLGTNASNEDNWIAHQDDFNQLLAELNNCHGQNTTNESVQEEKQDSFSLEEKSKSSRKRVHYMKFTKGKDLSSRSETDLACIFGKRSKPSRDQDEDDGGPDSPEEVEKESDTGETKMAEEPESNTVTSTLTMQEYFAQRMAQLKRARAGAGQTSALTNGADDGDTPRPSPAPTPSASETPSDTPNISDSEQPSGKKKKKKKRRRKRTEDEQEGGQAVVEDVQTAPQVEVVEDAAEEDSTSCSERKKKKKKKNKTEKEEEEAESSAIVSLECVTPLLPVPENSEVTENISTEKKKKKKKKKHDKQEVHSEVVEADQVSGEESAETKAENSDRTTKKKKRKREEEEEEEEAVVVEEKKSKKDKKKRKKKDLN